MDTRYTELQSDIHALRAALTAAEQRAEQIKAELHELAEAYEAEVAGGVKEVLRHAVTNAKLDRAERETTRMVREIEMLNDRAERAEAERDGAQKGFDLWMGKSAENAREIQRLCKERDDLRKRLEAVRATLERWVTNETLSDGTLTESGRSYDEALGLFDTDPAPAREGEGGK